MKIDKTASHDFPGSDVTLTLATSVSLARLCAMFDGPVLVTDESRHIMHLNPAASRLLQSADQRVIGQPLASVLEAIAVANTLFGERRLRIDSPQGTPGSHRSAPSDRHLSRIPELPDHGLRHVPLTLGTELVILWFLEPDAAQPESAIPAISPSLAFGVAHDVNGALTAIRNSIHLALLGRCDESVRKHLDGVLTATERAAEILRQILCNGKRGAMPVDVQATVQDSLALLRMSRPHSVELQGHIDVAPNVRTDCTVAQWHELILNLGWNAFDACREVPAAVRISLTECISSDPIACLHGVLPPGHYLQLEVRDQGCGIPPEKIPRIFEPFVSADRVRSGSKGIGLYIVRFILNSVHGGILVESGTRGGTTMRVLIPVQDGRSGPRLST